MSKIKTREDLLNAMSAYGACDDATEYVLAAPETATAREIWLGCADVEWLVWFGVRHRPAAMRAFAFACADRAVRVYAPEALARAGFGGEATKLRALAPIVDAGTARASARAAAHTAARVDTVYAVCAAARAAYAAADLADTTADTAYAAYAAYAAAARAADAARDAAAAAERRIQLDALHALADAVLVGA